MVTNDVDRTRVRSGFRGYVILLVLVGTLALLARSAPWYSLIAPVGITAWAIITTVLRRATSVTFVPDGVDVALLFRTRHLRKQVTEFDGSRFFGLRVRDLRDGKYYELPASRRLIEAAERSGYPVVRRPKMAHR